MARAALLFLPRVLLRFWGGHTKRLVKHHLLFDIQAPDTQELGFYLLALGLARE
jgi:hypothetical protein